MIAIQLENKYTFNVNPSFFGARQISILQIPKKRQGKVEVHVYDDKTHKRLWTEKVDAYVYKNIVMRVPEHSKFLEELGYQVLDKSP